MLGLYHVGTIASCRYNVLMYYYLPFTNVYRTLLTTEHYMFVELFSVSVTAVIPNVMHH